MKFNFKRISAVTSSLLVAGMSVAAPVAAANYPQPFVDGDDSDVAIVTGSGDDVSSQDMVQAGNIQDDLQDAYEPSSSDGGVSIGEGENINIGDIVGDLKLGDTIETNLYEDDLPTLLAGDSVDGEDYEQELSIGDHEIQYTNLGEDEDNYQVDTDAAENLEPVLNIDMSDGALWTYNLDFDDSLDAIDAGDETITIAGQDYTIDPNLEDNGGDDLVLYASTNTETFDYEESKEVSIGDNSYEVEVVGGRDVEDPEATVSIDGENYRVEAGETISHEDEEFYVNEVFMNTFGEESSMSVELFVGAQKLELAQGSGEDVKIDGETIDSVTGGYTTEDGLNEVTGIQLDFTPSEASYDYDADYNEYNYLEIDESVTDPVLGTINVVFDSMSQDFKEDKSLVSFEGGGDRLGMTFTNAAGNEYSVDVLEEDEWNILGGDGTADFEALTRDDRGEKFVLNKEGSEGTISHIAEISDVERDSDGDIDEVTISYGDETDTVSVGDSIRRSTNDLRVCSGVEEGDTDSWGEDPESFSLQKEECVEDDTNLYDGSLTEIMAENGVKIDIDEIQSGTATVTETDEHDDLSSDEDDIDFTVSYSDDDEYTVESDDVTEDDEGEYGYGLTNLGSYIEAETDDNEWVEFYTPEEEVTYDAYVAGDVSTSDGDDDDELGELIVKDSEVDSVEDKNLIVVGGSCINSVAADILGGDYCGAEFESETEVGSDQFLIQGVEGAYTSGKIALLVAGYEAEDTANAATYLTTQEVDTSSKYIGTSSSSADLVTDEESEEESD